jgi:hypothetical protein
MKSILLTFLCLLIVFGAISNVISDSEITGNIPLTGVLKEGEKSPNQLFDITFEVEDALILNISDLLIRITFESFGTEPTPVNLTYIITNEEGDILYTEKDSLTVETENVFTKKFEGIDLEFGKYIVFVRTLYNLDVEDEFLKKFEIRRTISKSLRQLFDITFDLNDKLLTENEDLIARVGFENFGAEPTPVNLFFTILNEDGDSIYEEEDSTIVETEKVFTKNFKYLKFEDGEYTLVLTTIYNVNVEDEFREKFIVKTQLYAFWVWVSVALNLLLISAVIFLLKRRKK